MSSLWKFGGLTPLKLVLLAAKKVEQDELSTRSASLSYYFLLALFPLFLFLLSLTAVFAGSHSQLRETIVGGLGNLAPAMASNLVRHIVDQTFKSSSGLKLVLGLLGALWAASGGMSAIVTSLNVVYQTKETRPWWKQKLTVVGLTLALAILMLVAVTLVLYGGKLGSLVAADIGLGKVFALAWKVLRWPVGFGAMFLSCSMVYYFAPDLRERRWFWVTPGAVLAIALWLVASIGLRVYLHFFNSYSAMYGSIGGVIILMLWLYVTGLAVLLGGELNWIIENEDLKAKEFGRKEKQIQARMKAA